MVFADRFTMTIPKRPALRWLGSKWQAAPWVISHFPRHLNYVEPYFGSGAVLLQKPRSKLEVVNDCNGDIFNFFAVVRDRRDELLYKLNRTPWHRKEYELCRVPAPDGDSVEAARRFFVRCWMCISVSKDRSGFRLIKDVTSSHKPPSMTWDLSHLDAVGDRLIGVQFESLDALKLLERYNVSENTLFYLDPPYLPKTRSSSAKYDHEYTALDHEKLLDWCLKAKGMVILSGYPSKMYDDALGWRCETARFRSNIKNGSADKIEALWLSPSAVDGLEDNMFTRFSAVNQIPSLNIPEVA